MKNLTKNFDAQTLHSTSHLSQIKNVFAPFRAGANKNIHNSQLLFPSFGGVSARRGGKFPSFGGVPVRRGGKFLIVNCQFGANKNNIQTQLIESLIQTHCYESQQQFCKYKPCKFNLFIN